MLSPKCDPTELSSRDDSINYALHFFLLYCFFLTIINLSSGYIFGGFICELDPIGNNYSSNLNCVRIGYTIYAFESLNKKINEINATNSLNLIVINFNSIINILLKNKRHYSNRQKSIVNHKNQIKL